MSLFFSWGIKRESCLSFRAEKRNGHPPPEDLSSGAHAHRSCSAPGWPRWEMETEVKSLCREQWAGNQFEASVASNKLITTRGDCT